MGNCSLLLGSIQYFLKTGIFVTSDGQVNPHPPPSIEVNNGSLDVRKMCVCVLVSKGLQACVRLQQRHVPERVLPEESRVQEADSHQHRVRGTLLPW